MADWATAAGSLGGAIIGGGVGYLGARLQAKITTRQIDAESQRHDEARREAAIDRRSDSYQQFLDHERWFAARAATGIDPLDRDGYLIWLDDYNHRYNSLVLTATRSVRAAAERLDNEYASIREALSDNPRDFAKGIQHAFDSRASALASTREELVQTMRRDTAPSD